MTGARGRSAGTSGGEACRQIVAVGLYTAGFDAARNQDIRNSLLLGGTLLLAGGAGFYLLFLTQRNRVARSTIETMRLYTRDVIESLPDALVTLDPEGRVVSVNGRARELLGFGDRDPAGASLHELVGAEDCAIEPLLRAGEEFRDHPMDCQRADCDPLPVKVSAAHITGSDGKRLGTVLLIRDVRELRAVEEQLERSRRLASLGQMAAGIAHEIRNPLGTLRGFAQYFGGKMPEDTTAAEYATLMVSEIDRLNRIIAALLQFARPREPEFQELTATSLGEKIEKLVTDEATAAGLTLRVEIPDGDVTLQADRDLLTQALLNLLHNAIAATAEGGEVTLGARASGNEVHITVDDTGRGLTPEEKERMFDPFYTTRKTGTGLGLAVVHQVAEQHGGRVEVESILGRGTRVTLAFPRKREETP
jgi:two-component system sensor histidine kinase HydH